MKKSELTIIGEYRLAPEAWGNETAVMIDEEKAQKSIADCFCCSLAECDPDGYDNDTPEEVELSRDNNNNYYVVYLGINDHLFQLCEDISEAETTGMLLALGHCQSFEEENTAKNLPFSLYNFAKLVEERESDIAPGSETILLDYFVAEYDYVQKILDDETALDISTDVSDAYKAWEQAYNRMEKFESDGVDYTIDMLFG